MEERDSNHILIAGRCGGRKSEFLAVAQHSAEAMTRAVGANYARCLRGG